MSNSAVVQFGLDPATAPAVYLHWHGDPATVQALLDVAKRVSVRGNDPSYAAARFVQIAANVIGGTTGIGVGPITQMTDRRTREPVRCLTPGCVHVGYWPRGHCPPHHDQVVDELTAAIARHRHPEPDPAPSGEAALGHRGSRVIRE